jgi:hypothetical protein
MQYEAVYLYNNLNQFLGVSIKSVGSDRLQTVNIWTEGEVEDFKRTLGDLNNESVLRQFWPSAHDPEVGELVENPQWEPLELHEEEVPDWDASTIVDDEFGGIDTEKSNFVMMVAMVPDPTEAQNRYYKAQEIVARRRAERALASDAPA